MKALHNGRVCGRACLGSYDPALVPEAPIGLIGKNSAGLCCVVEFQRGGRLEALQASRLVRNRAMSKLASLWERPSAEPLFSSGAVLSGEGLPLDV